MYLKHLYVTKRNRLHAFALSGHAENQADYTTAFGFLDIGNKLEFKSRNYDHVADALHVNTIMSAFYTVDANTFDNKHIGKAASFDRRHAKVGIYAGGTDFIFSL